MSLADKMKLQDLKAEIENLTSPRIALLSKQKNDVGSKIKEEIIGFFKDKGFVINGSMPKVTASYNGGLETVIDFTNLTGAFFGCDGQVHFKYEGRDFSIIYSISRGDLPREGNFFGSEEELLKKKLSYYENELLPSLKKLGVSDLTGECRLQLLIKKGTGQNETKSINSVDEALNSMIC